MSAGIKVRPNMEAAELHGSIVSDFEGAWDALAAVAANVGRGNFMFTRQVMALLEWACRFCKSDGTKAAIRRLSEEIAAIEPKYFTCLPGPCAFTKDFELPSLPHCPPEQQLLSALFDMARHGLSHQGQQTTVDLPDGHFVISLTGASHGATLAKAMAQRPETHLGFNRFDNAVFVVIRPEVMFLDFKQAIDRAGLLSRPDLTFEYLKRGIGTKSGLYKFDTGTLEKSLVDGCHARVGIRGVTDVDP